VTYVPPDDLGITQDRFSYAVKSNEGVSGAVDVVIRIVDLAADLSVPAELEFPTVLTGSAAEQTIEIANRGGLDAKGKVEVERPWRVEEPAEYSCWWRVGAVQGDFHTGDGGGISHRAPLHFAAGAGHSASWESVGSARRLTSSGAPAAGPAATRRGQALSRVVNNTARGPNGADGGSERLLFSRELLLKAGERIAVPMQTRASDLAALDEVIRIEGTGDLSAQVKIVSGGVGGVLRVPESISFG
jgi:hypothetical protein